jgi:hypothetical protein
MLRGAESRIRGAWTASPADRHLDQQRRLRAVRFAVALRFRYWSSLRIPGALLRRYRLEADLWPDLDARLDAAGASRSIPLGFLARSAADLLPLVATLADLPPSQPVRSVVVLPRCSGALCAGYREDLHGPGGILSDSGMTIERRDA